MTPAEEAELRMQYPGNSGSPAVVAGVPGSGTSWADFCTAGTIQAADMFAFYLGTVGPYGPMATGLSGLYAPITYAAVSTPANSGREQTKSSEQVAFENRKARLISVVNSMKTSAPNWYGGSTTVNETSASSAEKFIKSLPGNALLPRVAPDGEGDIMFVWDGPNDNCIVTVEKRTLHLVSKLGTPEVQHVPSQQFLGFQIPPAILAHIPTK
jgi:hypothetical protein